MPVHEQRRIRVLLADDHPMVIAGLKDFLSTVSTLEIVGEAKDGEEVLTKARLHSPDVVLMDISMPPGMNGIEATRQLRIRYPEVKVIFLSVSGDSEYVRQFIDSGAKGYILKRASAHEIIGAIEAVHNGEAFISPAVTAVMLNEAVRRQKSSDVESVVELTDREKVLLRFIADERNNKEIAEEMGVSIRAIESMRQTLMDRLNIHTAVGLARYAIAIGLVRVK